MKIRKRVMSAVLSLALLMSAIPVLNVSGAEIPMPTPNTTEYYTFEDGDMGGFTIRGNEMGLSQDMNFTPGGDTSIKSLTNDFQISKNYAELQMEKVVTVHFYDVYDDTANSKRAKFGVQLQSGQSGTQTDNVYVMANNQDDTVANGGSGVYSYRFQNTAVSGSSANVMVNSTIPRSTGWHYMTFDYTNPGQVTLSIDGIEASEHTQVLQAGQNSGYKNINIINYWTGPSSYSPISKYFDDITIESFPTAPTAPLVDDTNDTFGWTYHPDFMDASDYEISLDGGDTWNDVTSNPYPVGDVSIALGDVNVRVKDINEGTGNPARPGNALVNEQAFMTESETSQKVVTDLYDFATYFFEGDYTADSWASFKAVYDNTTTEIAKDNYSTALYNALKASIDALEYEMDKVTQYEFEDGSLSPNPLKAVFGTYNDDPYSNLSVPSGKGIHLDTELDENGDQIAKVKYTLAEPLSDKVLEFFFRDIKEDVEITVDVYDSVSGNGFRIYNNSTGDYVYYPMEDGVVLPGIASESRRNTDWHAMEYNFTNYGSCQVFIDERFIYENSDFTSFDTIEVTRRNHREDNPTATTLTMDNLAIIDKNPVTSIALPEPEIHLGYYDYYDININNYIITVEDDSYPTTDKFKYSSGDYDIANVTAKGTVENTSFGSTTATVTSSSGLSATIDVICEDRKVESVQISDSPLTIEPNFVTDVTMLPDTKLVLNAIMTPTGVTEREVSWVSSDSSIVSVQDGLLTAGTKEGTATITVTTIDGNKTASCDVVVSKDKHVYGETLYVSLDGDDTTGDGSIDQPYASIHKAQEVVRGMIANGMPEGGVITFVRGGTYEVLSGVEFTSADSGTEENPIKYMAYPGEEVIFTGSINFEANDMDLVVDPSIIAKLPAAAQDDKVYQYDLSDKISGYKSLQFVGHAIGNLTWLESDGKNVDDPYYSLTFGGAGQTLARWPNENDASVNSSFPGTTRINTVIDKGANPRMWKDDIIGRADWVHPDDRDERDLFNIKSTALTQRMQNWVGVPFDTVVRDDGVITDPATDIWMMGYWGANFSDQSIPLHSLSSAGNVVGDEPSGYSISSDSWARFYVYNLIQELDIPGEWYFDQSTHILYIYPPEGTDMNSNEEINFAVLEDNMFTFNDAQYITIDGISMSAMLGTAVEVNDSNYINIRNADISSTQKSAATVNGTSFSSGFSYCDVYDVNGGIKLTAGSKATLEKGLNYVEGCTVENFATMNKTYNPGIGLTGVGNIARFSEILEGPHAGILYYGNEHLIEFMEIHSVVLESSDQGAIFTGANVSDRDTIIRNSYFHDIPAAGGGSTENHSIYLDGNVGGIIIMDNVFDNKGSHTNAIFLNGGRDNVIIGNTFTGVMRGVYISDGPYSEVQAWYKHGYGLFGNTFDSNEMDYDLTDPNTPYAKYSHILTMPYDDMLSTKYNKVIDNVAVGSFACLATLDRGVQHDSRAQVLDGTFDKNNTNVASINYYNFTATAGANGSVEVSNDRAMENGIATAMAIPNDGYMFASWVSNGQEVSYAEMYTAVLTSDVVIEAQFVPLTVVDRKPLSAAYKAIMAMDLSKYTTASVTAMMNAVNEAMAPYSMEDPSQDEIDTAIANVNSAKSLLVMDSGVETDSTIIIETEKAQAGDEVMVDITLENNPGITSMKLVVDYDEDMLELVGVTFNKEFGEMTSAFETADANSVLILNWVDGTKDFDTADMTYATLKFKVKDTATEGDLSITASYDPEDVFNMNQQNVAFDITEGKVEVVEVVMGDTNSDGFINNKDVMVLLQYTTNMGTSIDMMASDLNDDGVIDNKDVMILFIMVSESV